MKIIVNGDVQEVSAGTLAELLSELDYEGDWLATAVNATLVHREDRAVFPLNEGDRVEILSPRQGG